MIAARIPLRRSLCVAGTVLIASMVWAITLYGWIFDARLRTPLSDAALIAPQRQADHDLDQVELTLTQALEKRRILGRTRHELHLLLTSLGLKPSYVPKELADVIDSGHATVVVLSGSTPFGVVPDDHEVEVAFKYGSDSRVRSLAFSRHWLGP